MQSSKVKLGERFAYQHEGEERALMVTEITTIKNNHKTVNKVSGYYNNSNGERVMVDGVEVADLIGEWTKHAELKAEEDRIAAERKAKADAQTAKRNRAIDLLAGAIGAQNVHQKYGGYEKEKKNYKPWDDKLPAVMAHYGTIEINEQAVDLIIAYFENVQPELTQG